jgi:hypothetical protein
LKSGMGIRVMFEEAMAKLDEFDKEMKSVRLRNETLIVTGQRMANLLKFVAESGRLVLKDEAKELVQRWEREFKND